MNDYIDPSEATHVRIGLDIHGWGVDAADDNGNYTEGHWTCDWVGGEPVPYTFERAKEVAPAFAAEFGLQHLPVRVLTPEGEKTQPRHGSCTNDIRKPQNDTQERGE